MKRTLLILLFVGISCFVFASSGTSPEDLKPMGSKTDWSKISAIATCVAAVTGIAAVYVYWRALKENQKLSEISDRQVKIQNSNILYEVYKRIIDKQNIGKGENEVIAMSASAKGVTIKEFFPLLKENGDNWFNAEFSGSFKTLCSSVKRINLGILKEIDANLNLTSAHKMTLIVCFGDYYGLADAVFKNEVFDFEIKYIDYPDGTNLNPIVEKSKFSKTPIYDILNEYNMLYSKYKNELGA